MYRCACPCAVLITVHRMAHHRASYGEPSFQSADSTDESKDTVTIDIQTRPKQAAEPVSVGRE